MQTSGKLVIVGIFGVAIAGVILTLWFQFEARRRSRDFWGSDNAVLIGRAPKVELMRLRNSPDSEVSDTEQLKVDGAIFELGERKDISKARGLVHMRDALIRDSGFQWNASRGDCQPQWEYAFRFADEDDELIIALDVLCRRVRLVPEGQEADISPMFQGIKELIDREFSAAEKADP